MWTKLEGRISQMDIDEHRTTGGGDGTIVAVRGRGAGTKVESGGVKESEHMTKEVYVSNEISDDDVSPKKGKLCSPH